MEIATSVISNNFDPGMLEQIGTLRTIRLNLAEKMLSNVQHTANELESRGIMEDVSVDELRMELAEQIATLRSRLERPDVIFADEISLYVDLLENDDLVDEIPIS